MSMKTMARKVIGNARLVGAFTKQAVKSSKAVEMIGSAVNSGMKRAVSTSRRAASSIASGSRRIARGAAYGAKRTTDVIKGAARRSGEVIRKTAGKMADSYKNYRKIADGKVYNHKLYKREFAKAKRNFKHVRVLDPGKSKADWIKDTAFKNTKRRIRNRRINKAVAVGATLGVAAYTSAKYGRETVENVLGTYDAIEKEVKND